MTHSSVLAWQGSSNAPARQSHTPACIFPEGWTAFRQTLVNGSIALNYATIKYTYIRQKEEGGSDGNIAASHDLKTNKVS